jgi:hypothetical protein
MWKLLLGFAVFAALALFILMKSGGDIDMGGEKHGTESHAPAASEPAGAASAAASAPSAAAPAASAASN